MYRVQLHRFGHVRNFKNRDFYLISKNYNSVLTAFNISFDQIRTHSKVIVLENMSMTLKTGHILIMLTSFELIRGLVYSSPHFSI